jgi:hypothetical protein
MKKMSEMPEDARVWVYQSNRVLSNEEVAMIEKETSHFLANWSSHGAQMNASCEVAFNRVLVIAADESQAHASGCGIDKSVNFVKQLGSKLGVDFFNRTMVLYEGADGIVEAPLHQFWAMRKALIIHDATMVVDTTVRSVGQFRSEFLKLFRSSWHAEMWGK